MLILHLFDQKWIKFSALKKVLYSCDGKAEFSAAVTVFSVTWSFRNYTNILIWCLRNIFFKCCFIVVETDTLPLKVVVFSLPIPVALVLNIEFILNDFFCPVQSRHILGSLNDLYKLHSRECWIGSVGAWESQACLRVRWSDKVWVEAAEDNEWWPCR